MYQGRIVDILVVLMDEIKSRGMEDDRMELISTELLKKGYSEQEISTAFSWILERIISPGDDSTPFPGSYRVLHDIEKIFISQEAYGYLLQLTAIGMLSYNELEKVIERALVESTPGLTMKGIKPLVAEIILGLPDISLHGSDIFVQDVFVQ